MKHAFTAALGVVLALSAQAQELRPVKLRAICFQHSGDIKKLVAVSGGEKPKAVEFPLYTTTFSDEVEVMATDGKLTFAVPDAAAGGPSKFRTIATANAVPGPRQLAIFIPGPNEQTPYRCFVVDDSEKAFPMGSTKAVNLASMPFRFAIGEHRKEVKPGGIENIPMASATNDRGQVSVIIYVADDAAEGGWRAVNQTRWFNGTDKRDLAIGFIHPKTGQPTVNCYADSPPWIKR